jgi:hypothetical protein
MSILVRVSSSEEFIIDNIVIEAAKISAKFLHVVVPLSGGHEAISVHIGILEVLDVFFSDSENLGLQKIRDLSSNNLLLGRNLKNALETNATYSRLDGGNERSGLLGGGRLGSHIHGVSFSGE